MIGTILFDEQIVAMFMKSSYASYGIAVSGLPLFALGFIFFAINIVSIGNFHSVKQARPCHDSDCFARIRVHDDMYVWFAFDSECVWYLVGDATGRDINVLYHHDYLS